jgi:proton-translocating NADH-quinone oxidoreductase chain N
MLDAIRTLRVSDYSLFIMGAITLQFDGISALLAVLTLLLGSASVLFSGPYLQGEAGEEKFYALFLLMCASVIGLGSTSDLFNLWVWFELMAISTYTLVAFYRNLSGAIEAGVKYLVQSALGSVLVLLGIALIFGQTGSLSLQEIRNSVSGSPVFLAAGALFIIGFGVKTALVPVHTWLPDAHSQAPSGISAMLSGVVIEAGLIALLRVLGTLSTTTSLWGPILLGFGALNMLVGNLMALRQTQIKRLLAYSSVAHIGYMVTGFGIAITFGILNGAQGGFFHVMTHSLMKGLAFLTAGSLLYALVIRNHKHDPLMVDDLDGIAHKYPLEALTFSIACLALGGMPLLAGFMSKWQIFTAGFLTGSPWIYAVVIFMALNSVLSLGYYAPLVNRIYRLQPGNTAKNGESTSLLMQIPLAVFALLVIIIGIYPPLFNFLSASAGSVLLRGFGF